METETLSKVTELIKSVNIGFDGALNSETLEKIITEATPQIITYLYVLEIKSLVVNLLWCFGVVLSAYLVGKAIAKVQNEQ